MRRLALLLLCGAACSRATERAPGPTHDVPELRILADAPGLAADEVERQVVLPLEAELAGIAPRARTRSVSAAGRAVVTVGGVSRAAAAERLAAVERALPPGASLRLGANEGGAVIRYTLDSERLELDELREVQDWDLRYRLSAIPGVAEVRSCGGVEEQLEIEIDPRRLAPYAVPLAEVASALRAASVDEPGGRVVTATRDDFVIRGRGVVNDGALFEDVVVATRNGVPVKVRDFAGWRRAPVRECVAWRGAGEVVAGIVALQADADVAAVSAAVLRELRSVPEAIVATPFPARAGDQVKRLLLTLPRPTSAIVMKIPAPDPIAVRERAREGFDLAARRRELPDFLAWSGAPEGVAPDSAASDVELLVALPAGSSADDFESAAGRLTFGGFRVRFPEAELQLAADGPELEILDEVGEAVAGRARATFAVVESGFVGTEWVTRHRAADPDGRLWVEAATGGILVSSFQRDRRRIDVRLKVRGGVAALSGLARVEEELVPLVIRREGGARRLMVWLRPAPRRRVRVRAELIERLTRELRIPQGYGVSFVQM